MSRFQKRRRNVSPLTRLILEMRAAARQIDVPAARAIAAREAASIPVTRVELRHSVKGKIAKHARALMRDLPKLDDVFARAEIASTLMDMAEVLASHSFEECFVKPHDAHRVAA
jgi:hypothetical protein